MNGTNTREGENPIPRNLTKIIILIACWLRFWVQKIVQWCVWFSCLLLPERQSLGVFGAEWEPRYPSAALIQRPTAQSSNSPASRELPRADSASKHNSRYLGMLHGSHQTLLLSLRINLSTLMPSSHSPTDRSVPASCVKMPRSRKISRSGIRMKNLLHLQLLLPLRLRNRRNLSKSILPHKSSRSSLTLPFRNAPLIKSRNCCLRSKRW
jgi:hypothetical protein